MSDENPYKFSEAPPNQKQISPTFDASEVCEPQLPIRLPLLLLVRNNGDYRLAPADLTVTDESLTILERDVHVFVRADAARSVKLKRTKLQLTLPSGEKRMFYFHKDPDLPLMLARLEVWLDAKLINNPDDAKRRAIACLKARCYHPLGRILGIGMCISLILLILMIGLIIWAFVPSDPNKIAVEDDSPLLLAIPLFHILTLTFFIGLSGIFYLLHRVVGSILGVIFHVLLILFSILTLNILGVIWGLVVCVRCFFIHFKYKRLLAKVAVARNDEEPEC